MMDLGSKGIVFTTNLFLYQKVSWPYFDKKNFISLQSDNFSSWLLFYSAPQSGGEIKVL